MTMCLNVSMVVILKKETLPASTKNYLFYDIFINRMYFH